MIYTLVLTIFLGFPGNFHPVISTIDFKTEKECVTAMDSASFQTDLPTVKASAHCEKRPTT